MIITGIQSTVVTMAMEVLHNNCNMFIHDLPNMNFLIPRASAMHIRQIPHAHVTIPKTYNVCWNSEKTLWLPATILMFLHNHACDSVSCLH